MCRVMHMEIIECLQQSVVHWHMLYSVNMEISVGRPKRIASAKRVGQVDQFEGTVLEHIKDASIIRFLPIICVREALFTCVSYSDF